MTHRNSAQPQTHTRRQLLGLLAALALSGCAPRRVPVAAATVTVTTTPTISPIATVSLAAPTPTVASATPTPWPTIAFATATSFSRVGTPATTIRPLPTAGTPAPPLPTIASPIGQTASIPAETPLAFSPDGTTLAVAEWPGVRLLSLPDLQPRGDVTTGYKVTSLRYDTASRQLAVGLANGSILLCEGRSGAVRRTLPTRATTPIFVRASLAFSADGRLLATSSPLDQLTIWETGTGSMTQLAPSGWGYVPSLAFTPDGTALVLLDAGVENPHIPPPATLRIWGLAERRELGAISAPPDISGSLSADGALLAFKAGDRAQVWEVLPPAQVRPLRAYPALEMVYRFRFSGDNTLLAAGANSGRVYLWRVRDGALLRLFEPYPDRRVGVEVHSLAVSQDGTYVAAVSQDSYLRLWRTD